jgi:hypothetical protein
MHHQRVGRGSDAADRLEILARVVADIAVEGRSDRERAGIAQQDGVTVGRALRHRAASDGAAGAAAVVDDDRLLECLAHLVGDDAPDDGRAATGRERYDQRDRPVGIVLREQRRCLHPQCRGQRRREQATENSRLLHSDGSSLLTSSLFFGCRSRSSPAVIIPA